VSEMDQGKATGSPSAEKVTPAPHTPLPWRVESGTGLVWGDCTTFEDGTPDRLGVPVTDGQLERPWAQGKGPSYEEMEANAAFIVRAVNNHYALVEALEAARERLQCDADEGAPGWKGAQWLVEQIDAALSAAKGET
jgi:hypothetical protein